MRYKMRIIALLIVLCLAMTMVVSCADDTESEAPVVTESQSESETSAESESQSNSESEAPAESESQSDSESETPTESESRSDSESEAPVVSESQSDSESEAPVVSESQSDSESEAPVVSESQSDSESEAPVVSESQSDSESEAPVVSESQSDSESEAPVVSESQSDSESETESETETKPVLPEIDSYDRTAGKLPSRYTVTGYCFDYVKINSTMYHQNSASSSTESVKRIKIHGGDIVTLGGWIGFKTKISSFGYCFDGDLYGYVELPDAKTVADSSVAAAGGEYRFVIDADTSVLSSDTHTVSFIAVLEDGAYLIFQTIQLELDEYVWDGVVVPDSEIVPADKETVSPDADLGISATDTENTYLTESGIRFETSTAGVTYSADTGIFAVSGKKIKINFADPASQFSQGFNKYKIIYSSTTPLKVIVTYKENGEAITDTVYLDAGERQMFSCLTVGYLSKYESREIVSLDIAMPSGTRAESFALYDVQTESVEIIGSGIRYIENNKYKLGIELAWGGGISFLLDKEDGNTSLSNLINNADTGRLIQQSYYGTSSDPNYECGYYGESKWGYNPVQGGNQYNAPSRIIDVQISTSSVYVKAQPRDWAKTELAPCYMENIYTLYSDRIQVDNRFTDFSGYAHPTRDQELPAFYTVGYLESFMFYNGSDGWTGGDLQVESALEFWAGNSNAYFNLARGNTETWCAWVNAESDYGLGLYTPNIDTLLAGRHAWNPTTDPTSGTCCYVAPLLKFKLVSYKTIEYSYLITSGSTQQIRDLFTEHKDFADNSGLTGSDMGYQSARR